MQYAWINRDYKWDSNQGEMIETCQWVGRNRLAEVRPFEMIRETGTFQPQFKVGNLTLRVVDYDGHYLLVTRDSRWLVPIYRVIYRLVRSLEIAWFFFIYVLYIWKLADHHPAEIPTWRNIKALNWLAKKVGK